MSKQIPFIVTALLLPLPVTADLRDPTLPGNLPTVQTPVTVTNGEVKLILSAIQISDRARHAIINGTLVNPGDSLPDGTQILKIHLHHVLVKQNGVKKQLYLVPFVKHPVK